MLFMWNVNKIMWFGWNESLAQNKHDNSHDHKLQWKEKEEEGITLLLKQAIGQRKHIYTCNFDKLVLLLLIWHWFQNYQWK
jgi:hypothetical protein